MFLQHMLAVLKPDGIVATVMPHGVLFRGGSEGTMRRAIIADDLIDTVIGLGPNLFYGTGIPAAILILRAKGSKPPERKGKVLYINADRDYGEGRAQNHLRPRDEEKITATYRNFADVHGFAKVVTLNELADNNFNCNIRRYADSAPPPEPHDVRAHLHGGVPMAEINNAKDLLEQAGLEADLLFTDRGDGYAAWRHTVGSAHDRDAAHSAISRAVAAKAAASPWPRWWADTVEPMLRLLPDTGVLVGQRRQLVEDFTAHTVPAGLGPLRRCGHGRHLVGTDLPRTPNRRQPRLESSHRSLAHHRRSQQRRQEGSQPDRPDLNQTPRRPPTSRTNQPCNRTRPPRHTDQTAEASNKEDDQPNEDSLSPAEIKTLKSTRTKTKKHLKAIDASLLAIARQTLDAMAPADAPTQALGVLRGRIEKLVTDHFATIEHSILAWYNNLANKYGTTLQDLETERDNATARLEKTSESWGMRKSSIDCRLEDVVQHGSDQLVADWVPLSDLAEVNPPSHCSHSNEMVSFVAMADVSVTGVIDNFELRRASVGYTPFAVGDVLVAKITPCFENGKGALVQDLPTRCGLGSTEFHVLRARSFTSNRYLYHLTRTAQFRARGEGLMSGSAGQRRVPTEFFSRYAVRLLPLEEQRRIAEVSTRSTRPSRPPNVSSPSGACYEQDLQPIFISRRTLSHPPKSRTGPCGRPPRPAPQGARL